MATVADASEAGEAFAAEFEKLVSQAASIADLVEQVRSATQEFEQMVRATLDELDGEVAGTIRQATGLAQAAQSAVLELSKGLDTVARDVRGEVVQLTRSVSAEIGHAIDQQAKAMDDSGKLAVDAVGSLNSELQSVLSDVRNRMSQVDQLWVEAHGANQVVHQQAKQTAQEFATRLAAAMDTARIAAESFAGELEDDVFVPIEQVLYELDEQVRTLSTRLFEQELTSLSKSVEDEVREQVGPLIDKAIEAITDMVKAKVEEILERRDKSEPERKSLEGIFDTLKNLLDAVEDKVGAVKEIKAIVGG